MSPPVSWYMSALALDLALPPMIVCLAGRRPDGHAMPGPAGGWSRWLVLIGGLARLTLALRGLGCHQDRRGSLRALPPRPGGGPGPAARGGLWASWGGPPG